MDLEKTDDASSSEDFREKVVWFVFLVDEFLG